MLKHKRLVALGAAVAAVAVALVSYSVSQAQPAKDVAPETLLPQDSILYIGWDGSAAHRDAWQQTAAHDALYESGLMDAVKKLFADFSKAATSGRGGEDFAAALKLVEPMMENGLSIALTVNMEQGGPLPQAVIVLHDGAKLEPDVAKLIRKASEGDIEFEEKTLEGRKTTVGLINVRNAPPIELGWWTEGNHLVVAVGIDGVNGAVAVAAGKSPNITSSELWKKYRENKPEYEVSSVAWLNFGSLREKFGEMPVPIPQNDPDAAPPKVNEILEKLGLQNLGAVVSRSGYKDRAMWSETFVESPGEKTGLMALADQKPITLKDLPPLPFGVDGFAASSVNMPEAYDTVLKVVRDASSLMPKDAQDEVEGFIANINNIVGFDVRQDLLDGLGNVSCFYSDTRQGMFGIGVCAVIKVKDQEKVQKTLKNIAGQVVERAQPDEVRVSTLEKHGREIVTFEIAEGMFNPSYAVGKDWLVIGLLPQSVEAFFLRVDGKLTTWEPTKSYQQGLDELPKEFTSISASDPRKGVRTIMGLAPLFLGGAKQGLKQEPNFPKINLTAADLPPAELVARPLFPNITVTTVDDAGVKSTTRSSLPSVTASIPVMAVGVALLLPAVQQAREAARRSSSKNNLKQIGLALHNYHDTHRSLPQGTHENDKLKPEERLSWLADILPFMDQTPLFQQIDFEKAWDADANQLSTQVMIPVYQNPSQTKTTTDDGTPLTHYVGVAGVGEKAPTLPNNDKSTGIFGYNRVCRFRDVTDGLSNTAMVIDATGESLGPWAQGGKSTVRAFTKKPYINGPDGIGSPHTGGCHVLLGDGSVRFISENIDPELLENLAKKADGNVIGGF